MTIDFRERSTMKLATIDDADVVSFVERGYELERALIEEARRHHRRRLWWIGLLIAAVVIAGTVAIISSRGGAGVTMVPSGTNASGQTYGSSGGTPPASPQLVAVIATNGRQGYAYQSAINAVDGSDVTTLAEAAAWDKTGAATAHFVAVYLSNGTTRIGTFQIGPGTGTSN